MFVDRGIFILICNEDVTNYFKSMADVATTKESVVSRFKYFTYYFHKPNKVSFIEATKMYSQKLQNVRRENMTSNWNEITVLLRKQQIYIICVKSKVYVELKTSKSDW